MFPRLNILHACGLLNASETFINHLCALSVDQWTPTMVRGVLSLRDNHRLCRWLAREGCWMQLPAHVGPVRRVRCVDDSILFDCIWSVMPSFTEEGLDGKHALPLWLLLLHFRTGRTLPHWVTHPHCFQKPRTISVGACCCMGC